MMEFPFLPFVLGEEDNLVYLPDHVAGIPLVKIPIHHAQVKIPLPLLDKSTSKEPVHDRISPTRFSRLLNIANAYAYDEQLGMPEWVMLDCALLPAFFTGFMKPVSQLSDRQHKDIDILLKKREEERTVSRRLVEANHDVDEGPLNEQEWFPIAEFCAIPRIHPHEVIGYSLYSLQAGWGLKAKALGLYLLSLLGYQKQQGIAQWSNLAAIKSHLRFNPLELIDPLTTLHSKAGETFIYRLAIPSQAKLLRLLGLEENRESIDSQNEQSADVSLHETVEVDGWYLAEKPQFWLKLKKQKELSSIRLTQVRLHQSQVEVYLKTKMK